MTLAWEFLAWTVIVGWVALGITALTTTWMIVDWYVRCRITQPRTPSEDRCSAGNPD